ncbi:MAG: thermonuclease family protein, partial [Lachnospiraceae bacterium]|nr:thermonuclease family protein [Lachnospiraceae bacterium]
MLCLTNFGIINCQARQSGSYTDRATNTIYASVVHVSDGDTITVRTKYGEKIKVRLYAIDAPEKAQPYGPQATGILKRLVLNEFVTVEVVDTD